MRIFRNRDDFLHIYNIIRRCTRGSALYIHNYVFMNTHFHLLAWVEDTRQLESIFKSLTQSYYHYYRRRYMRRHTYRGHLWHGRYKSIVIKDDAQWLQCGRYIELNPVCARICKDPGEYRWSSYHYYAYGTKDLLLRPIMYPDGFEHRVASKENFEYQEFVRGGIDFDYQQQKKIFEML